MKLKKLLVFLAITAGPPILFGPRNQYEIDSALPLWVRGVFVYLLLGIAFAVYVFAYGLFPATIVTILGGYLPLLVEGVFPYWHSRITVFFTGTAIDPALIWFSASFGIIYLISHKYLCKAERKGVRL